MDYLWLLVAVFAVGLIPAFGPPSWLFAVFFYHRYHLSFAAVVVITAFSTAAGRLVLAKMTRQLKSHIPEKYINNLEYAKRLLSTKQKSLWMIMGLFLLSPLPSAQLFEAAGLVDLPLLRVGLMFFFGRLVTLSIYLLFAKLTITSLSSAWVAGFTSPWAVAGALLMISAIIALLNSKLIIIKLRSYSKTNK